MDAPLQDCTIEERDVVRFLWAGGAKPVEIHRRMLAQYGQSTVSQRKVYEWVERFKSGRTRVTDEGRSGRPSTSRSQKASSLQEWFKSGRTHVTDEGRSGRPSTSRSRKASSAQEYRNQLIDITYALCCKADYVKKLYVILLTVTSIKAIKCILPLLFDSPSYIIVA